MQCNTAKSQYNAFSLSAMRHSSVHNTLGTGCIWCDIFSHTFTINPHIHFLALALMLVNDIYYVTRTSISTMCKRSGVGWWTGSSLILGEHHIPPAIRVLLVVCICMYIVCVYCITYRLYTVTLLFVYSKELRQFQAQEAANNFGPLPIYNIL